MGELLLLMLLGSGWGEVGAWYRQAPAPLQLGTYAYVTGGDGGTGAGAMATATMRTAADSRFALTLAAGAVVYSEPVPSDAMAENLTASIRAEYRLDERWHLMAEGRHTSTGRDVLNRSSGRNPGQEYVTVGLGWRW